MTDDEKIEKGLLIVNATILRHEENEYTFAFEENLTKVRPGDEIELHSSDGKKFRATVVENQLEAMTILYAGELALSAMALVLNTAAVLSYRKNS